MILAYVRENLIDIIFDSFSERIVRNKDIGNDWYVLRRVGSEVQERPDARSHPRVILKILDPLWVNVSHPTVLCGWTFAR